MQVSAAASAPASSGAADKTGHQLAALRKQLAALNKELTEVVGSDMDAESKVARTKLLQSQIQAVQNQIEALQRASQLAQQAAQREKALAAPQGQASQGEGRPTRAARGWVDLVA